MPGFFETIERDVAARSVARRLAAGCPSCEAALVPIARREARTGLIDPHAERRVLARHRRHASRAGHGGGATIGRRDGS